MQSMHTMSKGLSAANKNCHAKDITYMQKMRHICLRLAQLVRALGAETHVEIIVNEKIEILQNHKLPINIS